MSLQKMFFGDDSITAETYRQAADNITAAAATFLPREAAACWARRARLCPIRWAPRIPTLSCAPPTLMPPPPTWRGLPTGTSSRVAGYRSSLPSSPLTYSKLADANAAFPGELHARCGCQ